MKKSMAHAAAPALPRTSPTIGEEAITDRGPRRSPSLSWAAMARKRAALITGGGRGIGFACAKRLAAEGVACALLDVRQELAQEAARSLGSGHVGIAADVTDRDQVARAFREAAAALGPVNVVVNSAGIAGPTAPAWELDPA